MKTPVLSVLNMKGGVGKTTVSAHVMRVLYHRWQKRILLVDLDAQFNLTQTIVRQDEYDTLLEEGKSIVATFEPTPSNDFFQIKKSDQPPPLPSAIRKRIRRLGRNDESHLDLIPGSFELMKYSLIDDANQLKAAASYFARFISQAREHYDLIVLDCNPSSSFVTKCALENSTHVISPVRPDKYSILGVGMVDKLFKHLGVEVEHLVIFNGVRRNGPRSAVETELRTHSTFGPKTLIGRLVTSNLLAADPSYTGFATDKRRPYSHSLRREIEAISDEVAQKLGFER